jgi:hypothetical protein
MIHVHGVHHHFVENQLEDEVKQKPRFTNKRDQIFI